MYFLQYFILGIWLVNIVSYMSITLDITGSNVVMVLSSKVMAAINMPGIKGIIAEKWLRSERDNMICHLHSAAALMYDTTVTDHH
ncbi:MFS transporter, partial [Salmonella enterica subsp. enterica serovar Infantis]